ncbi:MAG: phosphatidylglycerophosphate synthase [Firmicutes bacterium]|nr:phosphatidylglycerophosphate synthase [Bacillota bacterium]
MTLANFVTLLRLLVIPVVIWLHVSQRPGAAAVVFALAAATDAVDGWLARRRGEISTVGKWLDPVADKFLQATALVLVTSNGFIPLWLALVLVGKELALIIGGAFLLRRGRVISARPSGKMASLFLFPGLVAGLADLSALRLLLYVGALLSVLAGLDYLLVVIQASTDSTHAG